MLFRSPGESFEIKIKIENTGDDLENIILSLDLEKLPFIPKDSIDKTIKSLESDEDEKVSFEVDVLPNAKSNIYTIPFIIKHNGSIINEGRIAVTVTSEPRLILERRDGLLLKGQKNKVGVKIVNKGLSDIKFLEVKALKSSSYDILGSDYLYLGEIESDDFDSAEFDIFINKASGKEITFPVELTYRDITNKEYKETLNLNLRVYDLEEAYSLGLINKSYVAPVSIGIVFMLLVWIVYRKIRKARRLKAKKQQQ